MILKYKTNMEYGHDENATKAIKVDRWNYVDGITDCGIFYDQRAKCTCIEFGENDKHMVLALHDEAYLINDNGKTIEKIAY